MVRRKIEMLLVTSTLACSGCDATNDCKGQHGTILMPWAEGTRTLDSRNEDREHPYLNVSPEKVEAITADGRTTSCWQDLDSTTWPGQYACGDENGIKLIRAVRQGRTSSWEPTCNSWGNPDDLVLTKAAPCVESGTIVVEGDLLNIDSARQPPIVVLEGPEQRLRGPTDLPSKEADASWRPGVNCTVEDAHYACPTLGFDSAALHNVVINDIRTQVMLKVDNCEVRTRTQDITCPEQPFPLRVVFPPLNSGAITATVSYEGGDSYGCTVSPFGTATTRSGETVRAGDVALCPPAPGDEWGRGRYEVTAVVNNPGRQKVFRGSALDPFDACGGSEPIELELVK